MTSREVRSELLQTVEAQKEQLHRYETRLRDVVTAYKGLLKEKEALGATVKALSVKQVSTSQAAPSREKDPTDGGDTDETDSGSTNDQQQLAEVKTQLVTLTQSLMTLTSEKNKMEATYQAEKKKLRHDYDEKLSKADGENERLQKLYKEQEKQVQQVREKVRKQQHERDTEHNDHSLMLRELQKLLSCERIVREQLEQQLEELNQELREKRTLTNVVECDHHERKIEGLLEELEAARKVCSVSEVAATQLSASIAQLRADMTQLKTGHHAELLLEQKRSLDANDRQSQLNQCHEQVVSDLETKLSQLSVAVGDYEHVRVQDQANSKRLQERIAQLQQENSALVQLSRGDECGEDGGVDIQGLVEKIVKLKTRLKSVYEKGHTSVDVEELLQEADGGDLSEVHNKCREEHEQLREEFERYKLRAQSVLKNIATKDSDGVKELDVLKAQVLKLKGRSHEAQSELSSEKEAHQRKEEDLHRMMESLREYHRQEQLGREADYKQKAADLEREIRRHRDRTIALLVEKDRELETMRAADRVRRDELVDQSEAGASSCDDESIVTELLAKNSVFSSPLNREMSLLHYAQEKARHDVEITNIRRQKHSLEMALRELQRSSVMKAERFSDEIEALTEQVRKLERSRSRESANMEYLKNVVYHYMISHNCAGRLQMANAIATILQFSPAERDAVHKRLHAGWWANSTAVK